MEAAVTTEEERTFIAEADDPVAWSENHLFDPDIGQTPFKTKRMFYNLLRDPRKDRAGRIGRQSGKTVHMTIDMMYTASWETHAVILVFVPEKKNMNRTLEIMGNLLRQSDLRGSFVLGGKRDKKEGIEAEYDYEIRVSSGSVIRFFFMSHNPDKARGQRGTHIYIDEVDYLPEKAFPVILGVLKSNPTIKIWASSTPIGLENTWFREFCDRCADPKVEDSVEYHMPTTMEENWPEIEKRLRAVIFDEVTWKLEVMAEWVEAKGAVYKKTMIDNAIERSLIAGMYMKSSELQNTLEYSSADKVLGVDWNNPQNGVRLVEVAEMYGELPWVVRNEKISYETYTQLAAVNRIIELFIENRYRKIALDAGFGETQIELLHKKLVEMGQDPRSILIVVDSGRKEETVIEYESPETGARRREIISVRLKNRLVGILSKYIESSLVFLQEEDIEKDGLIKEVRNFRRKSPNRESGFMYTETTHSLAALQLAVYGYDVLKNDNSRSLGNPADTISTGDLESIVRSRMATNTGPAIISQRFSTKRGIGSRTDGLSRGGLLRGNAR